MERLSTLYLFIHPIPGREQIRRDYMSKWEKLFIEHGGDETKAICLLSNAGKGMSDLRDMAQKYFCERCIVDPEDNSVETRLLLNEDLQKTMANRGTVNQWFPYEIWTSGNARRWTEGLKKKLADIGFTYEEEHLHLVTCGQQWGGCLTKYSAFMAKYMGLTDSPDKRADLSPDAGFPVKAKFKERINMDHHVYLFLFITADGRPMAQYFDGLRAVWEPPRIATVKLDVNNVEVITISPNAFQKVKEASKISEGMIVADVGDGCHPAFTTLIGNRIEYEKFRSALINAKIESLNNRHSVQYMVACLDPVTASREDK